MRKGGMKQKHLAGGVLRPGLTYTQSMTTITVTIKVANVSKKNVVTAFAEGSIKVEFLATMPKTQAYLIDISTWSALDPEHCRCDVNTKNIVLELAKAAEGEWLDLDLSGPSPGPSPAPSPYLGSAGQGMDFPDIPLVSEMEEEVKFEEDADEAVAVTAPANVQEDEEDDGDIDADLPPLPSLESLSNTAPASAASAAAGSVGSTLSNQLLFELD
jgi:hypothetical protein